MTNNKSTNSWTLRLTDDQDQAVEDLAERRGCSKNQAVQHLINNIDKVANENDRLESIEAKMDAMLDEFGVETDTGGNNEIQPASATDTHADNARAITTASGDKVVPDNLTVHSEVKINPFSGTNFGEIVPQTVAAREGVLAAMIRFLRDQQETPGMTSKELETLVSQAFPDYGPQSIQERIDGLENKGVVFPHPLADPHFTQTFEKARSHAYGDHDSRKDAGELPHDWESMLNQQWWVENYADEYYLGAETYLDELYEVVESLADKIVGKYRDKMSYSTRSERYQRDAYIQAFRHLTNMAEMRTTMLCGPDAGLDSDDLFAGIVRIINEDIDASEVDQLEDYVGEYGFSVTMAKPAECPALDA